MTLVPSNADASTRRPLPAAAGRTCSAALIALVVLGGCAQVANDPEARAAYEQTNDPAEPTNRVIFAGNQWVDRNALRPVARAYEGHVPNGVRRSVGNFNRNLREPSVLVNDALQGNFSRAWTTVRRFAVNTTIGGAGLFDVAADWDLPAHQADFGQTLGVWGIGPGPSVQLPLLGPSNVRDTAGTVVGFVINPLGFVPGNIMQTVQTIGAGVGLVDGRARTLRATDDLERNSLDYYATQRSISAQRRAALVEEGRAGGSAARADVGSEVPRPAGTSAPTAP